jgi:hypothetical protein
MVGHPFDLLAQSPAVEPLDGIDYPSVEEPLLLVEKAAVSNVVSERVLEGVLDLVKDVGLIKKFSGLKPPEGRAQFLRAGVTNSL